MATIHINNELLSAAKAYRETFLLAIAEEQVEIDQLAKENDIAAQTPLFLYRLAEAVIQTEKVED